MNYVKLVRLVATISLLNIVVNNQRCYLFCNTLSHKFIKHCFDTKAHMKNLLSPTWQYKHQSMRKLGKISNIITTNEWKYKKSKSKKIMAVE
jgi:hypothetical protein